MKIKNANKFYLDSFKRFLHIATVSFRHRDFFVFVDKRNTTFYIEEIVGGHLERIEDNQLAEDLELFANYHKLLSVNQMLEPTE